MNAKQKFIAQVEALKENDPLGAWYETLDRAARAAAEKSGKSYAARKAFRKGFRDAINTALHPDLPPLKLGGYKPDHRGYNAGLAWLEENPRPNVDPAPHKIDLHHSNGVTHYTLPRDNVAIDGFIKRLKRLPLRMFK